MSVHTKTATLPQIKRFTTDHQVTEATRFAQYTLLDELPGLVFGLMTVLYIVSSLCSLA